VRLLKSLATILTQEHSKNPSEVSLLHLDRAKQSPPNPGSSGILFRIQKIDSPHQAETGKGRPILAASSPHHNLILTESRDNPSATTSHSSASSWLHLWAAVKVYLPPYQICRAQLTPSASVASDDDSTIKVAPKKVAKDKPAGKIKLKTPAPKQNKPGNWRDGSVIEGLSSKVERS